MTRAGGLVGSEPVDSQSGQDAAAGPSGRAVLGSQRPVVCCPNLGGSREAGGLRGVQHGDCIPKTPHAGGSSAAPGGPEEAARRVRVTTGNVRLHGFRALVGGGLTLLLGGPPAQRAHLALELSAAHRVLGPRPTLSFLSSLHGDSITLCLPHTGL